MDRSPPYLGGRVVTLLCCATCGLAWAAESSAGFRGGAVLQDGASEHRLELERSSWQSSAREDAVRLSPEARWGLTAGYDLRAALPIRQVDTSQELIGVELELGIPIVQSARSDVTLALSTRLLPASPPLGSGSQGAGVAVHISDRLGATQAQLDGVFGFERTDVARRDEPGYAAANRLFYASRIELPIFGNWAVSGEVETHIGLAGDEVQNQFAFFVRPGLRWAASPTTTLRLSVGRDFAERNMAPESTALLSIVHRPVPQPSRGHLLARIEQLEAQSQGLEIDARRLAAENQALFVRTEELGDDHAFMVGRMADQRDTLQLLEQRSGTLQIELYNRSGERASADRMAAQLEALGHRVVRLIESPQAPVVPTTRVEYRDGLEKAAEALSGVLSKEVQAFPAESPIGRGADVRVLLGADLSEVEE